MEEVCWSNPRLVKNSSHPPPLDWDADPRLLELSRAVF